MPKVTAQALLNIFRIEFDAILPLTVQINRQINDLFLNF